MLTERFLDILVGNGERLGLVWFDGSASKKSLDFALPFGEHLERAWLVLYSLLDEHLLGPPKIGPSVSLTDFGDVLARWAAVVVAVRPVVGGVSGWGVGVGWVNFPLIMLSKADPIRNVFSFQSWAMIRTVAVLSSAARIRQLDQGALILAKTHTACSICAIGRGGSWG